MAAAHRGQLLRLNIPGSLNMQQPMAFDNHQPMFSPALPTSLHPPFQIHTQSALQTPMQQFFHPQAPGAPVRAPHLSHHKGGRSIAQLAAAGIHPPNGGPMSGVPMTPLGHNFPPQLPFGGGQGYGPQSAPRNRRTQSMSFGGPPKAVLGGPARKVSPMPPPALSPIPTAKGKKVTVNLPQETIPGEEGQSPTQAPWARMPLDLFLLPSEVNVRLPDIVTAVAYPPDSIRCAMPNRFRVFLPRKVCCLSVLLVDSCLT
jgi:hypothetical protein